MYNIKLRVTKNQYIDDTFDDITDSVLEDIENSSDEEEID